MDERIYNYPTQGGAFMDKIMKAVSLETGYSEELICMKNRKREIVESRQLAMRLAKQFTNASLADIGRRIGGKDHATVLHACKTINNLRDSDRKFAARYDALFLTVGGMIVTMGDYTMVCKSCGGAKVQIREWVDANTRKFIDTEDKTLSTDNWCSDCESPTTLIFLVDYLMYQDELQAKEDINKLKTIADYELNQQMKELEKELGV